MIVKLMDACARHRLLVILLYGVLAVVASRAAGRVQLDAIPDLADPQVIVVTEWSGQSPTVIDEQITYPVASRLLGVPRVAAVRAYSMVGMSFVHVVFEEGTDIRSARSRVAEQLGALGSRLPGGVLPTMGPEATSVGWVYEYALVNRSGAHGIAELRSLQDFTLRYALESVPGVAEVATIGGAVREFQVTVDPAMLRANEVTFEDVATAVRRSNAELGGRLLEMSGREHFVRGRAQIQTLAQLEQVVVRADPMGGRRVRVSDVASVKFGSAEQRGFAELDGHGEAVGAIVVARYEENALDVIARVRSKLGEVEKSLPPGVEIVTTYDRSSLIERAIGTLKRALSQECATVAIIVFVFLLHVRSSLLPIVSMPLAALLAFVPMYVFGIPSTIMSLGGIAIALAAVVDAEVVMIEACHRKLEAAPAGLPFGERAKLVREAAASVTPTIFCSLVIIAISFLPVFGLSGEAGKLFRPLAFTKTFVVLAAALLSVTFAPALRDVLLKGTIRREMDHPLSRWIRRIYEPFVYVALRRRFTTLAIGALALLSAVPLYSRLGTEFMPALDEGDILFMPTTLPTISMPEARRQLALQDAALQGFPEVKRVFGKVGRAETATDPAPPSMVETVIELEPPARWPLVHRSRFYSAWAPTWAKSPLGWIWPENTPETRDELITKLDAALARPGFTNAWTMPIKARMDMLSTGIRTPVGIKIFGADQTAIDKTGEALEKLLRTVPGTRSALYERSSSGSYVDIVPRREAMDRHAVDVEDLRAIIEGAIGGEAVSTTTNGRERIAISVRYQEAFRDRPETLRQIVVPLQGTTTGIPLGELVDIDVVSGPELVRQEAGMLVGHLYVDTEPSRDTAAYVEEAKAVVELGLASKATHLVWTGEYQRIMETRERMPILIVVALSAIFLLLYVQFKNVAAVLIVFLSIPFALVGSIWLLYLLDYRLSTAVWVGIIALVGLAAQTGVVMIMYIDQAFERRVREGRMHSLEDILAAHAEGTVQRVRPKVMTVSITLLGLLPLLWATGSGADVMKRMAAPMIGGLVSSAFLTLELIPVVYTFWREAQLRRAQRTGTPIAVVCNFKD